jgi:G3E family GTPase
MYVYILGGFLGSGKTSLLLKLARMYTSAGKKVAIIENESGEIGVDGATLKAEGYDAVELPDGCICCTLSGSLQAALRSIKKDIEPDIIIIEPTGLALPHKVKEIVRIAMIDQEETLIIGIADIQRFDDLIKRREEFFKRQMHGSDFILINKSDLGTPEKLSAAIDWLKDEYPEKEVIPVSNKTGENLDRVYELMK